MLPKPNFVVLLVFRHKWRFAPESKWNSNRSASVKAAGSGKDVWIKTLLVMSKCYFSLNRVSSSWRRCWRPAWSQWDACPTLTTINGSLAKLVATVGLAFDLQAACGREREAGQDARLNRCLRWRVTSTYPQSQLNNTTVDMFGTRDCRLLLVITLYLVVRMKSNRFFWGNMNKDEPFVQKIKNFIKHNCLWEHGKKQNNIKIQNIFTSIVKQHAE